MDGTLWNEEWFEEWLHELDRKIEMQGKKVVMIVNNCSAHPEVSRLKTTNLQFCHQILLPLQSRWISG